MMYDVFDKMVVLKLRKQYNTTIDVSNLVTIRITIEHSYRGKRYRITEQILMDHIKMSNYNIVLHALNEMEKKMDKMIAEVILNE